MQLKSCSVCSADMTCGSTDEQCWCMAYEPISGVEDGKDCLCEACLKEALAKEEAVLNKFLVQEDDYYIENGFYVFTRSYHLKRGSCCKNGCRHCPYGYKK
ncbi:DUF5522 domain-containing protein [Cytophaga aurantiaca]|uniref:DUF5522 domain-containing protein n=1 Tax=Cytophaga aurantiaca TaxID=29530 RepID=UPI000372EA1B|nr:DUF5522 domain-containing protein [Cytophaga aurantiaca]